MSKKILIATGIFPPDIGGPATYVETLLNELPKHGFDVRVVTYSSEIFNNQYSISNIFRISRKQNIIFRYLKYFIQVWKHLSWADIVYIQDPISAGIPASLACRLRGKKYYMKIVGDYAWEQGRQKYGVKENLDDFQSKKYSKAVERIRRLQKFTVGGAEKVITPSNYLKKIIISWGVDGQKVNVIYNSVRPAQTIKNKDELRRELDLNGNIIVSVGRLVPWKGFDTLIELMPELLKINPDFKLLIIGEGVEIKNYELRIKNLRLENKVFLLGALEQSKLWEYMKASDFFVLNTGYEGLPHIVIEAMYLGLPVITTYAGGNTEVVRPGDNGILVEYNNRDQIRNAILKLWKDSEVRDMLIENAKRDLFRFGTERMVDEVVDMFIGN